MNKYQIGETDQRTWGTWEVLDAGEGFCLKRLFLLPFQKISKQRHQYRGETWIIATGSGRVLIDKTWHHATPGNVFRIPKEQIHQLESLGEGLTVIELQTGKTLDEADIERFPS